MKPLEDPLARLDILLKSADAPGPFFKELFLDLLSYSAEQMPIIAGEVYKVDEALKAGFGWSHGPFEIWDALGFDWVVSEMDLAGILVPDWIKAMQAKGEKCFYTRLEGQVQFHSLAQGNKQPVPGKEGFIVLSNVYPEHTLWSNSGTRITNLGDGVLNLSFHTKMNSIGAEVIQGLHKAIDMAETEGWNGLVISNDGENFSAGANLALILMLAIEQEWDELNFAVKAFQKATMRLRYSSIPVVVAPHGLTLGGGCEMCLHADAIVASAETYIGLVEVGVGLIPGGGGSKEFALRAANEFGEGGIRTNVLRNRFLTIGQAKVATSALQAFELGIFRPGLDRLVMNGAQRIGLAKQTVLLLAEAGYVRPQERTDIQVLGREGLGIVYAGANSMQAGHYISEHDRLISEKLGYVMCGGDLTQPSPVSEAYLLDLEREAFLSLLGTKPTLQRIQHMLKTGKPLRN
jgi:3-hydroxyacyl-CoA dehydrogenase